MISLKAYNTFGIDAYADAIIKIESLGQFKRIIKSGMFNNTKTLILGGGSNVLFTSNFDGTIYIPMFNKIEITKEDDRNILIKCGAGVAWDYFVEYCVSNDYAGVENLSYIPGSTGATPIQNIGAYGVEVKDVIKNVEAIDLSSAKMRTFSNSECNFAYRNSIFKTELKGQFVVTSVTFKLQKKPHSYNIDYGRVSKSLAEYGEVSILHIRKTIIHIRKERLPEPTEIGNAGSFFKNPIVTADHFKHICLNFNDVPSYPADNKSIKLQAAWLIEKCGWKGKRQGDAGVHKNQALVLVNYGKATGTQILNLSEEIIESVFSKFNIKLEREVNVI